MNLKELNAPSTTITFNREQIESKVGNIYEAIVIIGKRAEQVNTIIKNDLNQKLDEFASNSDSLDEIFENREQIEVSKYYEKLPKPTLVAIQEWLNNEVYFRKTDSQ
jgi:DNA-directed RNA polymerase subunit K/omega